MKKPIICFLGTLMIAPTVAQVPDKSSIYNMTLAELLTLKVLDIATGTSKILSEAPAVASVISANDIQRMGATSLQEVLSAIPGVYSSVSGQLYTPKILIRGITSKFNPETLLLVDGIPMTSVFRGDRQIVTPKIHLRSIQRIEVIRGPGSALYGADAFAGVINIITKSFNEKSQNIFGADIGSYNSVNTWAQSNFQWGATQWFIGAEYSKTDGHNRTIKADSQTALDNLALAPPASFAPAGVNVGFQSSDIRLNVKWSDFTFKAGFTDVNSMGTGEGVAEALDPQGLFASDKVLLALDYERSISDNTDITSSVSYFKTNQKVEEAPLILPPGTFFGAFEQGLIGTPESWEYSAIAKTNVIYRGIKDHTIRFEAGVRRQDMYRVKESKNFDSMLLPYPQGLVDVSDTSEVFLPEESRNNFFAVVQDEYQLNPQWQITAGLRYDNYTDFGSTINPRLALVWKTSKDISTKFLYGRAFRAPAFVEQYTTNNPVALGNPDIKPEVVDTYEIALSFQLDQNIHWDINVYRFDLSDRIEFIRDPNGLSATAQNTDRLRGLGLESELKVRLDNQMDIEFSYSVNNTQQNSTGRQLGGTPKAIFYAAFNWKAYDSANLNLRLSRVSKQRRGQFDQRQPLKGYTDVSLFCTITDAYAGWDLNFKLTNAFDEDIRHPSVGPAESSTFANIPGDLPQAGRRFTIGFNRAF